MEIGTILHHKHFKGITIELLETTAAGWKVRQTELFKGWSDKPLRKPKTRIAFYPDFHLEGDKALFKPS